MKQSIPLLRTSLLSPTGGFDRQSINPHRFSYRVLPSLVLFLALAYSGSARGQTLAPANPSVPPPATPSSPVVAPGTAMTHAQMEYLFDSLDLTLPALASVQKGVAQGDFATAQHALAQYFRDRTSVPWKIDPHHIDHTLPYDKVAADNAVAGHVGGAPFKEAYTFPNGDIVWRFNVTFQDKSMVPNSGWQGMQISRTTFWDDLATAYRATDDERYAKTWVRQLRSFLVQCPPPLAAQDPDYAAWQHLLTFDPNLRAGAEGTIPLTVWTTIDSGIRMMGTWPSAFNSFLLSPSVTDQDILIYAYLVLEHGWHLHTYNTAGNWLTMEMNGLYTAGAFFPEFKEATEWRNYAVQRMVALEKAQFLPDGAHEELSTGYGTVAIGNITSLYEIAKAAGRVNELPADYLAPLEKVYTYYMYFTAPDRQIPQFNDGWPNHIQGLMGDAIKYFPPRQDFLWFATDGKQGTPPTETSHAADWAGFYEMRAGWDLHANYLVLRAGPLGTSHSHQDKLNLIMWVYGREILFNSGGGPYDSSKSRAYSVETFSKNSVVVDGLSQYRDPKNRELNISKAPIDARWESTPDHDFVAGTYNEGYGTLNNCPATHSRRVLFLKPDLVIVSDTLTPNDANAHTYQARWQLMSTHTQKIDATGEVMTTDVNLSNLDIVPLNTTGLDVRTASGQTDPEMLGWRIFHESRQKPLRVTTVLQTREGTGVQSFLTLLVPLHAGFRGEGVKSVTATGPGSAEVLFNDGRKLGVAASADPSGGIEATETMASRTPGRHVNAGGPSKIKSLPSASSLSSIPHP